MYATAVRVAYCCAESARGVVLCVYTLSLVVFSGCACRRILRHWLRFGLQPHLCSRGSAVISTPYFFPRLESPSSAWSVFVCATFRFALVGADYYETRSISWRGEIMLSQQVSIMVSSLGDLTCPVDASLPQCNS